MNNKYICYMCGIEYEKGWSDEEAIWEQHKYWRDVPMEELVPVCDECFRKYWPETNPKEYSKFIKQRLKGLEHDRATR